MPNRQRPIPRTADVAFLRGAIHTINEIRGLRKYADDHVIELRLQIASRVERALWNRYKVYHKKNPSPPTYFEWLLDSETLHRTYWHYGYETRLYWVYRVIQSAKHESLALFSDEPDHYGDWYFEYLQRLINLRRTFEAFNVEVQQVFVLSPDIEDPVPTVQFTQAS